jgi:porin
LNIQDNPMRARRSSLGMRAHRLVRRRDGISTRWKVYRIRTMTIAGSVFAGATYSPSDRNLIELYLDGGLEFVGLNNHRPRDKFSVAAGYAKVPSAARALDADFQQRFGRAWPRRDAKPW